MALFMLSQCRPSVSLKITLDTGIARMDFGMLFQSGFEGKSCLALVTFEGFVSSVNSLVYFEIELVAESSVTVTAFIYLGDLTWRRDFLMSGDVSLQMSKS